MKKQRINLLEDYHNWYKALLILKDYANELKVVYKRKALDSLIDDCAREIEALMMIYEKNCSVKKEK